VSNSDTLKNLMLHKKSWEKVSKSIVYIIDFGSV